MNVWEIVHSFPCWHCAMVQRAAWKPESRWLGCGVWGPPGAFFSPRATADLTSSLNCLQVPLNAGTEPGITEG